MILAILIQYRRVMGGQTDRLTDRQTHNDSQYHASVAHGVTICV